MELWELIIHITSKSFPFLNIIRGVDISKDQHVGIKNE